MALLKPFRALRYDAATAGPLDSLVAPPYDVVDPELRARLIASSPYNAVRLIRPDRPRDVVVALRAWREMGVLVREERPALWLLEDTFRGPDGVSRSRRAVVGRVKLEPYAARVVLPHERTFAAAKEARLRLLLAARTKLSPIFLIHDGSVPEIARDRAPDLEATFAGVTTCLWRVDSDRGIEALLAAIGTPLLIADGHHRYEAALAFHERVGGEDTGHVLAALVSTKDAGLVIFPTHRMIEGFVPELDGLYTVTPLDGGASEAADRLGRVPRDRGAFVLLSRDGAVLAEGSATEGGVLGALDTVAVDRLELDDVTYTASAVEAERAVSSGAATAAFLVRAPTVEQVAAVALAGETMPPKSTYFFPKLLSGLLFAPFDE